MPIPCGRGVETAIKSSKSDEIPTNTIAFSLILGFAFMLFVEQLISGHDHSQGHEHVSLPLDQTNGNTGAGNGIAKTPRTSMDELDREVAELEGGLPLNSSRGTGARLGDSMEDGLNAAAAGRARAYPLTLGLVIHSLADGLALGASALPRPTGEGNEGGSVAATTQLSIVVFLALIIHKGKHHFLHFVFLLARPVLKAYFVNKRPLLSPCPCLYFQHPYPAQNAKSTLHFSVHLLRLAPLRHSEFCPS